MQKDIDCPSLVRRLLSDGYTTKSLGDRIGLSQPSVSRLARGLTKGGSFQAYQRLIELAGGQIILPPLAAPNGSGDAAVHAGM